VDLSKEYIGVTHFANRKVATASQACQKKTSTSLGPYKPVCSKELKQENISTLAIACQLKLRKK
jgi:hypothetical protein